VAAVRDGYLLRIHVGLQRRTCVCAVPHTRCCCFRPRNHRVRGLAGMKRPDSNWGRFAAAGNAK
jgi:hypothetical protein